MLKSRTSENAWDEMLVETMMTIDAQYLYDMRSGIDIELWPSYSWVRVVSNRQKDDVQRELAKLRKRSASVPALLIRSSPEGTVNTYSDIPDAIPDTPNPGIEVAANGFARTLGTFHYSNPPGLVIIRPLAPIQVSLADSFVLWTRMCSQDIYQLHQPEFYANGCITSILASCRGIPQIRVPMDHSHIVPLCKGARQAWEAFKTMFAVPGFVLTFELKPPDYLSLDNRRCLCCMIPSQEMNAAEPIAKVYFWGQS